MDRIEVRLLGPMWVRRRDGSVVDPCEWRTTKTVDLLRLLALDAGHPVAISSLVDSIWPDVDAERGRASLRNAASQLRKVLDADCLERRGCGVILLDTWVDTQAYTGLLGDVEASRHSGQHARTVTLAHEAEALYAGDIEVPDTSGDWLHKARDQFRAQRSRMLLDASDAAASLHWMRDSHDFAQRAAAVDTSEEAARALIRALAGMGEVEKAMAVFDRIRRDLADRFGVDPSPQTRALHLQLLTGTAAVLEDVGLVGHEDSVDALAAAISAMRRNGDGGGIVWLQGEPGSGRDSVVEAACRQADLSMHNMNHDAAWLHGEPADHATAWENSPTEVLVMPCAASVPHHALGVLSTLAQRHKRVLVVPVRHAPATEPEAGGRRVPSTIVEVGPLPDDALVQLASVVFQGAPTSQLVRRLRSESGGLSGLACRVARRWLNTGRVIWTVDGLDVCPPSVGREMAMSGSLRRTLRLLSPLAEDVVNVVAVAGVDVMVADLTTVVGELHGDADVAEVQEVCDRMVDSGLLREGPAGYRLREGHARQELLGWMRPRARQRVHALVADVVPMAVPL